MVHSVITTPASPDKEIVEIVGANKPGSEWRLPEVIDPRATNHLETISTVAALVPIGRETRMFLTSSHWAELAREIEAKHQKKPSRERFAELIVGRLHVINSGTEDQGVVNEMNREHAEGIDFQARRARLITGKVTP